MIVLGTKRARMHTRVTEGARREFGSWEENARKKRLFSHLGLPPSFLASRGFAARRCLTRVANWKKRETARRLFLAMTQFPVRRLRLVVSLWFFWLTCCHLQLQMSGSMQKERAAVFELSWGENVYVLKPCRKSKWRKSFLLLIGGESTNHVSTIWMFVLINVPTIRY